MTQEQPLAEGTAAVNKPISMALIFGAMVAAGLGITARQGSIVYYVGAAALFIPVAVLLLRRPTYRVWSNRVERISKTGTASLEMGKIRHLFTNFPSEEPIRVSIMGFTDSLSGATATSGSIDSLEVVTEDGRSWVIPGTANLRAVRNSIIAHGLPSAVEAAERTIASGGTYWDPKRWSGMSASTVFGKQIGLRLKPAEIAVADIKNVSPAGLVTGKDGASIHILSGDMVMEVLLDDRNLNDRGYDEQLVDPTVV